MASLKRTRIVIVQGLRGAYEEGLAATCRPRGPRLCKFPDDVGFAPSSRASYTTQVAAVEAGTGVFSQPLVVSVGIVAPSPVTDLVASPGDGDMLVSWSLGNVTGGAPLTYVAGERPVLPGFP
jgi:hypothetical protein